MNRVVRFYCQRCSFVTQVSVLSSRGCSYQSELESELIVSLSLLLLSCALIRYSLLHSY